MTTARTAVWAYVAGLVDGEGTIWIQRKSGRSWQQSLSVANTDPRIMEWLRENFGGYVQTIAPRKAGHSPSYIWTPFGRDMHRFLLGILPYAVIKREQVEIAVAYRRLGSHRGPNVSDELIEKREALRLRLRVLTKRGVA